MRAISAVLSDADATKRWHVAGLMFSRQGKTTVSNLFTTFSVGIEARIPATPGASRCVAGDISPYRTIYLALYPLTVTLDILGANWLRQAIPRRSVSIVKDPIRSSFYAYAWWLNRPAHPFVRFRDPL